MTFNLNFSKLNNCFEIEQILQRYEKLSSIMAVTDQPMTRFHLI